MKKQRNIEATVVAASINPAGQRITTMLWTYPRFIHSEIMTHRQLSRNAASSRAIPVEKMIKAVEYNPAHPEWWGAAQKGMQANTQLEDDAIADCYAVWEEASTHMVTAVQMLLDLGLHKQISNRLLEPWGRISVLVTATEFDNFFGLRAHPDAQPEFQVLAYRALDAYLKADPVATPWGGWHIPMDGGRTDLEERLVCSVANAARVSYLTFDKERELAEQRELYDRLTSAGHWSPTEHQAQAAEGARSGNFQGWHQHRHSFDNEVKRPDLHALLANKPEWISL